MLSYYLKEISPALRSAFIGSRLLNIPFWYLLSLLPMIVYKDLQASPWIITMMIVIKPASALVASYWSSWIHDRPDKLLSNLVLANLLRYLPFLIFPWVSSPLWICFALAVYMMLSRGVMPAWMELFRLHVEEKNRPTLFTFGSALDYLGTALVPFLLGWILDGIPLSWRYLFPIAALFGLASTWLLLKLPQNLPNHSPQPSSSLKSLLLKPWKNTLEVLKNSPEFTVYQIGFMWGGAGLMFMQTVIPEFFVDVLALSYTKMLVALAICKSIGYAVAAPLWLKIFDRKQLIFFSGIVSLTAAAFPFFMIGATWHLYFLYAAYTVYGMMQAGSELSWQLSGPSFSHHQESTPYSTVNILLVGIRGCLIPPLGGLLFFFTGSSTVLMIGALCCLISSAYLLYQKQTATVQA